MVAFQTISDEINHFSLNFKNLADEQVSFSKSFINLSALLKMFSTYFWINVLNIASEKDRANKAGY
jgi:hypothetical protein